MTQEAAVKEGRGDVAILEDFHIEAARTEFLHGAGKEKREEKRDSENNDGMEGETRRPEFLVVTYCPLFCFELTLTQQIRQKFSDKCGLKRT